MQSVIAFARRSKSGETAALYMPPRIVDEITGFFDNPQDDLLKELFSVVTIKAPDSSKIEFPAAVFYRLIDDVRGRSYRGLQIAEEEVEKTAQEFMGRETLPKIQLQKTMGPIVKGLRMRYRNATRNGFLDSVADLDLIVLAKELNGSVVSADEGVLIWARHFGVKETPAPVFGKLLSA
jgi:RNA ligase partner protein